MAWPSECYGGPSWLVKFDFRAQDIGFLDAALQQRAQKANNDLVIRSVIAGGAGLSLLRPEPPRKTSGRQARRATALRVSPFRPTLPVPLP